jgi:hypothetical protein
VKIPRRVNAVIDQMVSRPLSALGAVIASLALVAAVVALALTTPVWAALAGAAIGAAVTAVGSRRSVRGVRAERDEALREAAHLREQCRTLTHRLGAVDASGALTHMLPAIPEDPSKRAEMIRQHQVFDLR